MNINRKEEKRMLNEPGKYVAGERLNVANVVNQKCTISFKPNWIIQLALKTELRGKQRGFQVIR